MSTGSLKTVTLSNFISRYSIDPWSQKLNTSDKLKALIGSVLALITTFGILHLYTYFYRRNFLQLQQSCHQLKLENFSKLQPTIRNVVFRDTQQEETTGILNREHIGRLINEHLISPCYARNKPPKNQVEVPVPADWNSPSKWDHVTRGVWKNLTKKQKVEVINHYALSHNKIPKSRPEILVDLAFLWNSHSGVQKDPRSSHGSDHAIRAAIWAAVFAYLYEKYHPHYNAISLPELLVAQFAAAGHDCARQTESVDVFDLWSAEITKIALGGQIGASSRLQDLAFNAINCKDVRPDAHKPLIAKCVQNADCAEFPRLLLKNPQQTADSFNESRSHLDIWNELNSYAQEQLRPGQMIDDVQLKNGHTFKEFIFELDAIRIEMNHFIYSTRTKDKREVFSQAPSYYDAVLAAIKPKTFPLLNTILRSIQVLS